MFDTFLLYSLLVSVLTFCFRKVNHKGFNSTEQKTLIKYRIRHLKVLSLLINLNPGVCKVIIIRPPPF